MLQKRPIADCAENNEAAQESQGASLHKLHKLHKLQIAPSSRPPLDVRSSSKSPDGCPVPIPILAFYSLPSFSARACVLHHASRVSDPNIPQLDRPLHVSRRKHRFLRRENWWHQHGPCGIEIGVRQVLTFWVDVDQLTDPSDGVADLFPLFPNAAASTTLLRLSRRSDH